MSASSCPPPPHLSFRDQTATWAAAGSSHAFSGNRFYTAEQAFRLDQPDFTTLRISPSDSASLVDLHRLPEWLSQKTTMKF